MKVRANSSLSYTGIAKEIISYVMDNYINQGPSNALYLRMDADIKSIFGVLWKDIKYSIITSYDSYSYTFDFIVYPCDNDDFNSSNEDFISFKIVYGWE
ncbi:hypothetical protein CPTAKMNP4_211 [Salmonella phage vB_SenM-AKM_NP4]|uniref:DUF7355 domain-containing protein n=2 Tax=Gelderlandvirus TaxID=1913653 RepID=M1H997_BPS16|nr:hypothetical protein I133_gp061 [Salmonella phage vB_SenM-S16]YP_009126157.1 hypothetical protein STP4a_207 [Salmonella phage STP4-a]UFK27073.1 hypothetical protein LG358_00052 [Escherichia phage UoN_LG358_1]UPW42324.1 hypothetical protein EBPHNEJP_00026 [Salmonella phage CF-SP2]WDR21872.1 hypothetical protein PJM34_0204 [Salmonella phage vB_SenM_UTK0003]WKV23559.1 hypothetical protein SEA1_gp0211 [Salmonella phage SEA1]WLI71833.1 hypothetical protein CPTAKMNP4_211 [Salmonella phage vB_Sen